MKNKSKVEMGKKGRYVARVRCAQGHSGNRGLTLSQQGWYACAGCGQFFAADTVLAAQSAPTGTGENMAGGLYTVTE